MEVDWEEVARGFELDDGKQVVLTDLELAIGPAAQDAHDRHRGVRRHRARSTRSTSTTPGSCVPFGESEGTLRAYRLLVKVMESTDRAALGRFVMRTKEYLVLVRPRDGLLSLTTLLFHDEVRPTDGIAPSARKPAKKKVDQAVAVIEALAVDWDPERYTDCYRERLTRVVKAKQKGKTVKAPSEPKQPKPAPDLMEALEETLEQMAGGALVREAVRRRRRRAGSSSSSMLCPVTISTIGPSGGSTSSSAASAAAAERLHPDAGRGEGARPPARSRARRPARTACPAATSSSTASGTATRTARPSAKVARRSHSTGCPAADAQRHHGRAPSTPRPARRRRRGRAPRRSAARRCRPARP